MAGNQNLLRKIGQRMVVGLSSVKIDLAFVNLVKTYKISNVILFSRNVQDKFQLAGLCSDIQKLVREETGHAAFIAIDQEGGAVSRLPADATGIPGAMAIAASGKPENAYTAGKITGLELKALGINFDFAPVLDVNSNRGNPVIGIRSYGSSPNTVIQYGIPMMKGLLESGVMCAAKHFPGHGDTSTDSHLSLPCVDKSMADLENTELLPFRAAIRSGVPAVMSAHILFPKLEKTKVPATMSRTIITGLLKERFGFQGIVVSDCLEMNAIKTYYGTVEGAVAAMKAGIDMVLISHTAALAAQAAEAIKQAALSGELDMAEMDHSVNKILAAKKIYAEDTQTDPKIAGCPKHKQIMKKIMAETIAVRGELPPLGDSPCFFGCRAYRSTLVLSETDNSFHFAQYLGEKLQADYSVTPVNPTDSEISQLCENAKNCSCAVVGLYNGRSNPGQLKLANALAAAGVPVVAVALGSPYDLESLSPQICPVAGFEYSADCFDILAQILTGKYHASGKINL